MLRPIWTLPIELFSFFLTCKLSGFYPIYIYLFFFSFYSYDIVYLKIKIKLKCEKIDCGGKHFKEMPVGGCTKQRAIIA